MWQLHTDSLKGNFLSRVCFTVSVKQTILHYESFCLNSELTFTSVVHFQCFKASIVCLRTLLLWALTNTGMDFCSKKTQLSWAQKPTQQGCTPVKLLVAWPGFGTANVHQYCSCLACTTKSHMRLGVSQWCPVTGVKLCSGKNTCDWIIVITYGEFGSM